MATYKTPGVYVEEIPKLPPSVAEVSTAIPAFIGYTEKRPAGAVDANASIIRRISTMLEYETLFGGPAKSDFTVTYTPGSEDKGTPDRIDTIERKAESPEYNLYYSLSLYFKNGGGGCYVVSIGNYKVTPSEVHFTNALEALKKEDEPTLIMLTDAVVLDAGKYYSLAQEALKQCHELKDRFVILDVLDQKTDLKDNSGNDQKTVEDFRDNLTSQYLMYGAAYYPSLLTTLVYDYNEDGVTIQQNSGNPDAGMTETDSTSSMGGTSDSAASATTSGSTASGSSLSSSCSEDGTGSTTLASSASSQTLDKIKTSKSALYSQIKTELSKKYITMYPSAAVAGVYASVDRDRGVWKAPANVGLASVIGPVTKITNTEQDNLNIDPNSGKSINAIRAFTGKGTLVWGARTLAGNDNEWRYVPVRRLFNMIEESIQKATAFAVFEPNDAGTWLKVKAMIESYLYGLWQQGALAGPSTDDAYYVHVGLGKTMTSQDVLEGRMIVEIGVAAVRPAEFIVLRFMHKLQQA